jgi:glycosyltransferase involved in cell wall biosynthesis
MVKKENLWIVSDIFYPNQTSTGFYLTEIAKYISNYSEVNVITKKDTFRQSNEYKKDKDFLNIKVHEVWSPSLNKNNLISRFFLLFFVTFSFSMKIIFKVRRNDKLILVTNPAFLVPVASILAKIKKLKLIILVHDVFPENLVPGGILSSSSFIYNIFVTIFNKSYSIAQNIVVCGRDMAFLFEKKIFGEPKNKIVIIENWADVNEVKPSLNNIEKDKFVFQFAGNIGRLQGLEQIIEIAELCENSKIQFEFIGDGALKRSLMLSVESQKIKNVIFRDSFERSSQDIVLNDCDVGIVSLYDEMLGLGVPSKSYNIMAAGKPILFLGNAKSEIAMVLREFENGWVFELNQKEEIVQFLNNFKVDLIGNKGKKSRQVAEQIYSKEIILEKYKKLLGF